MQKVRATTAKQSIRRENQKNNCRLPLLHHPAVFIVRIDHVFLLLRTKRPQTDFQRSCRGDNIKLIKRTFLSANGVEVRQNELQAA
jgi:hypothetical protein